jgi:uncharacterized protein YkwD
LTTETSAYAMSIESVSSSSRNDIDLAHPMIVERGDSKFAPPVRVQAVTVQADARESGEQNSDETLKKRSRWGFLKKLVQPFRRVNRGTADTLQRMSQGMSQGISTTPTPALAQAPVVERPSVPATAPAGDPQTETAQFLRTLAHVEDATKYMTSFGEVCSRCVVEAAQISRPAAAAPAPIDLGGYDTCPECEEPAGTEAPWTRRQNGTGYRGKPNTNPHPELCAEEWAFLNEINAYRAKSGLAPLRVSARLTRAAQWHAQDMGASDYLDHTDSRRQSAISRLARFGYWESPIGENVAVGRANAREVLDLWKSSPGHNANMLRSSYTVIGIARRFDVNGGRFGEYGYYWSTPFGGFEYPGDIVQEPPIKKSCR